MFGRYHKSLQPYFGNVKTAFDIANIKVKEAETELKESYEQMGKFSNTYTGNVLEKNRNPKLIRVKANLAAALRKIVDDLEKKK